MTINWCYAAKMHRVPCEKVVLRRSDHLSSTNGNFCVSWGIIAARNGKRGDYPARILKSWLVLETAIVLIFRLGAMNFTRVERLPVLSGTFLAVAFIHMN